MEKHDPLLKAMLSATDDVKYTVLGVSALLKSAGMPDTPASRAKLNERLSAYVDAEYLACKYSDADNVCILALPKGRAWEKAASSQRAALGRAVWHFVATLVAAFVGTMLALLIFR